MYKVVNQNGLFLYRYDAAVYSHVYVPRRFDLTDHDIWLNKLMGTYSTKYAYFCISTDSIRRVTCTPYVL